MEMVAMVRNSDYFMGIIADIKRVLSSDKKI